MVELNVTFQNAFLWYEFQYYQPHKSTLSNTALISLKCHCPRLLLHSISHSSKVVQQQLALASVTPHHHPPPHTTTKKGGW